MITRLKTINQVPILILRPYSVVSLKRENTEGAFVQTCCITRSLGVPFDRQCLAFNNKCVALTTPRKLFADDVDYLLRWARKAIQRHKLSRLSEKRSPQSGICAPKKDRIEHHMYLRWIASTQNEHTTRGGCNRLAPQATCIDCLQHNKEVTDLNYQLINGERCLGDVQGEKHSLNGFVETYLKAELDNL